VSYSTAHPLVLMGCRGIDTLLGFFPPRRGPAKGNPREFLPDLRPTVEVTIITLVQIASETAECSIPGGPPVEFPKRRRQLSE